MERDELEGARLSFALASRLIYEEPSAASMGTYAACDLFSGAPFGADDPAIASGLALMDAWCARWQAASGAARDEAMRTLKDDWFQLLVGAGEPEAPCWAGYYLATSSPILSEKTLPVRHLYARHGFELARKNREPDDNLGIMLGFIGHLIDVELAAGEKFDAGDSEGSDGDGVSDVVSTTREDQCFLLREHILPWVCTWQYAMERHARTDFCRGMASYVFGLLRSYAQRFGIAYEPSGVPSYWVERA